MTEENEQIIDEQLPDTDESGEQDELDTQTGADDDETGEEVEESPKKLELTEDELNALQKKARQKGKRQGRREAEIEFSQRNPQPQQLQADIQPPKRDAYANDDEWIDAKIEYKQQLKNVEQAQQNQIKQQRELALRSDEVLEQAEELPGFDRELFDELIDEHAGQLSAQWANALIESDQAAKVMEYLTMNPKAFERIAELTPARQVAELGKIEAKLETVKKSAVKPLQSTVKGGNIKQTNIDRMSSREYDEYKRKQGVVWLRR